MRKGLILKETGALFSVASVIDTYDENRFTLIDVPDEWPSQATFNVETQSFETTLPVFYWTPLEFMRKFTAEERKALRNLAKTDDAIEDWMHMIQIAQEIRSDDEDVQTAMNYLVHLEVLTSDRIEQIIGSQ